jgi:D-alanyl-D-alanine carboxypeptidase
VSFVPTFRRTVLLTIAAAAAALATALLPRAGHAEALLLIEADSGKVLQADNATYPWYPASLTKLMTAYVTLQAVKSNRITLDTLLTVSPTAAAQQPSKMGFAPGTRVTVDNALKMMMVKSANDMAVVLAEGVGGSIDGFSALMNETALQLGMTQSHFVNPNGLPADGQVTSARDIGILARALIRNLPDYEYYVHIPAIKFGRRVTQNFNRLIGRYPGADGMKTGFICASGFNLVASATRDGRRLIAVVLGASSSRERTIKAAELLDRGFGSGTLAWLRPALGTVEGLAPINAAPPNLREEVCGPKRKRPAAENEDEVAGGEDHGFRLFAAGFQPSAGPKPAELLAMPAAATEPVIVYTGPARTGTALIAAAEEEAQRQDAQIAKARAARQARQKRKQTASHGAKQKPAGKDKASDTPKATATIDTRAAKPAAPPRHNGTAATASSIKPAAPKATAAKPAAPKTAAKPAAAQQAAGKRP